MERGHQLAIEAGEIPHDAVFDVPKPDYAWLLRWRRYYHVSYRTITLRLKCGRAKLLRRLQAFWSNVLSLRIVWEELTKDP
eukprot:13480290-Alexandrium_andersonii.AAC.1